MNRLCQDIPRLLEESRETLLGQDDERLLQAHLVSCTACRQKRDESEPLGLFSGLTTAPLPPEVESYILGGLRVGEERDIPETQVAGRVWPAVASLAAAAALVMVWAVGGREDPVVTPAMWVEANAMDGLVATVEDIDSPTAEIFAFTLSEPAGGRTEVILIVDQSIDM